MATILNRASRNFLWRHPWQLALALLGISLGVAGVIAIELALESSLRAFEQAGKAVSGAATHRIVSSDGGLDERLYARLRIDHGFRNLAPVIQAKITVPRQPEANFKLVGIDPFIEKSFHSVWQKTLDSVYSQNAVSLVTEPKTALLSANTARKLHLKINDKLPVVTDQGEHRLRIVGFLSTKNTLAEQALQNVVITDLATAQELTGFYGKLSFIDVLLNDDGHHREAQISDSLPANVQLLTLETQTQSVRRLTEAFSINLTALSLLSLLVGMFLIYNTMTFLVIQRRPLIGNLRLIGVTRGQIFRLIVKESMFLAVIGIMTGILLGIFIGQGLLQRVSTTMNSIYFSVDGAALILSPWQIGKGALLGLTVTLLAVLVPAWEATRLPPAAVVARSQLESGAGRLIRFAVQLAIALIVTGIGLTYFSENSIKLGLSSIFLLMIGIALLTPKITLLIMSGLEPLLGRFMGVSGRLPPRMIAAEISRTGIAIAALTVAVAATIGMDLMIGSFRQTVSQWLRITLQADLYVALPADKLTPGKAEADQKLKAEISQLSGVAMLSSVLRTRIIGDPNPIPVSVFELNERSKRGFTLRGNPPRDIWRLFEQQQSVIITEAYAYHHRLAPGATIRLHTSLGLQDFTVLAIYTDYSGDQGHIAMSRRQYLRFWPDLGYSGIRVYAQPNTDLKHLENRIRAVLSNVQTVRSNAEIFKASMQVFKETFSITETLRWLAGGIAFVGVFGALMALQFERTRQLGIMRAIGMTPGQITLLITSETGLMGLVAGLLAIPAGFIVAYLLIFVVYQRSFGWTMAFHINPVSLIQGLLLAFFAALLAGILPAKKMAQTRPASALRSE